MLEELESLLIQSDMERAYVHITKNQGPSQQLLDFINYDKSLGRELGLESFDSFSTPVQHEILLSKLNPDINSKSIIDNIISHNDKNDISQVENELDLFSNIDRHLAQLDRSFSIVSDHVIRKSDLMSSTSELAYDDVSIIGLENIASQINKAHDYISGKIKNIKHSIDSTINSIKERINKIIEKINLIISKIKEKAINLGKTIKAHPIKSILIAVATIAAIVSVIVLYKEYRKGYSAAELKQFTTVNELETKIQDMDKDFLTYLDIETKSGTLSRSVRTHENNLTILNTQHKDLVSKESVLNADIESLKKEIAGLKDKEQEAIDKIQEIVHKGHHGRQRILRRLPHLSPGEKSDLYEKLKAPTEIPYQDAQTSRWNIYRERQKAEKELSDKIYKELTLIQRKTEETSKHISATTTELPKLKEKLTKYKDLLSKRATAYEQTKKSLISTKSSWDNTNRSFYSRVNNLTKGTFLSLKSADKAVDVGGMKIPEVVFDKTFPPLPEEKKAALLDVSQSALSTLSTQLKSSLSAIPSAISGLGSDIGSNPSTKDIPIISALYRLLKDILFRCITFISSSLNSIYTQLT